MRRFFFPVLLLVIFSLGMSVNAANLDTPISVYTLDNGHKVIIKEVNANPIVTIDTWVKTGTANETPEINGVSHFLEHLMFKGTPKYKNGEFEKILESKGARCNAATSKEFTHYYVTIASEYLETALKLHANMMQHPSIPSDELERERKVVQEEIRRANDNPKRQLIMNLFGIMFPEHPYKLDTLGPHEVIENIPREKIFEYYKARYNPANMATVIVGDVDTEEALKLAKQLFNGRINNPVQLEEPEFKVNKEDLTDEKVIKGDYKSGYAMWGFNSVPITSIKETYALDMAASILGGSRTSRLYQKLKEEMGIVSDIGASHYSLKDDSVFIISADFEPKDLDMVKKAVLKELDRLRTEFVTDDELERAKTSAKRSFIYENESVENIANTLGYVETLYGSVEPYENHLKYIDSIDVEDIKKVAKKYLNSKSVYTTVILPEETPVNIVSKDLETIKNTTKSKLKNGITLITNQNPSNDIISMSVMIKGGEYIEPEHGTADILARALIYGTKGRPYQTLLKEIETLGISISPSAKSDYFEIKLKATKNDFNRAFDILVDIVQNPAFEQKYIEKIKKDILTSIKKSRDYPITIASDDFIQLLYNDHPYGNTGERLEESVPSITREDVVEYWEKVFIPENMVVSVSGDVDHTAMSYKLLENFLSSGKQPPKVIYKGVYTPLEDKKYAFTKKDSEAAWIFLGWPVGNIDDNKEFAIFRVMEAYLANGLSSRLHYKFREEEGLAYRVGCSYTPKKDKGHFVLYIGTAPSNIELVKSKFLKEIELLKTEPLSQEELENAKSKLIGSFALSQETNQSKAHLLGAFEVIDKEFGFNYDFPDLINEVTSEDIQKAASKYFSKPYALSITAPRTLK